MFQIGAFRQNLEAKRTLPSKHYVLNTLNCSNKLVAKHNLCDCNIVVGLISEDQNVSLFSLMWHCDLISVRLSCFSYSLYMSGMQCDLILIFQLLFLVYVLFHLLFLRWNVGIYDSLDFMTVRVFVMFS